VLKFFHLCCTPNATKYLSNSSPLYLIVIPSHLDIVIALHEIDKNLLNISKGNENTIFHSNVRIGHMEFIKYILDNDTKITTRKHNEGYTIVHMVTKGYNVCVVE